MVTNETAPKTEKLYVGQARLSKVMISPLEHRDRAHEPFRPVLVGYFFGLTYRDSYLIPNGGLETLDFEKEPFITHDPLSALKFFIKEIENATKTTVH